MVYAIAGTYQHAVNAPDWMMVEVFFEMSDGSVRKELMPLSVARAELNNLVRLPDPAP